MQTSIVFAILRGGPFVSAEFQEDHDAISLLLTTCSKMQNWYFIANFKDNLRKKVVN